MQRHNGSREASPLPVAAALAAVRRAATTAVAASTLRCEPCPPCEAACLACVPAAQPSTQAGSATLQATAPTLPSSRSPPRPPGPQVGHPSLAFLHLRVEALLTWCAVFLLPSAPQPTSPILHTASFGPPCPPACSHYQGVLRVWYRRPGRLPGSRLVSLLDPLAGLHNHWGRQRSRCCGSNCGTCAPEPRLADLLLCLCADIVFVQVPTGGQLPDGR